MGLKKYKTASRKTERHELIMSHIRDAGSEGISLVELGRRLGVRPTSLLSSLHPEDLIAEARVDGEVRLYWCSPEFYLQNKNEKIMEKNPK